MAGLSIRRVAGAVSCIELWRSQNIFLLQIRSTHRAITWVCVIVDLYQELDVDELVETLRC